MSHQQQEYDQLQGARPCCYRGDLELKINHVPESACCKAKELVVKAKFFCKLYNRTITNNSLCWSCTERKEKDDADPVVPDQV